jgi:hypothetical protein
MNPGLQNQHQQRADMGERIEPGRSGAVMQGLTFEPETCLEQAAAGERWVADSDCRFIRHGRPLPERSREASACSRRHEQLPAPFSKEPDANPVLWASRLAILPPNRAVSNGDITA